MAGPSGTEHIIANLEANLKVSGADLVEKVKVRLARDTRCLQLPSCRSDVAPRALHMPSRGRALAAAVRCWTPWHHYVWGGSVAAGFGRGAVGWPMRGSPGRGLAPSQGVILFCIGDRRWTLDLASGSGSVREGELEGESAPDLTLTMNDDTFSKLVSGKLAPQQAFIFR